MAHSYRHEMVACINIEILQQTYNGMHKCCTMHRNGVDLSHRKEVAIPIIHYQLEIEHHWRDKANNDFPSSDKLLAAALFSLTYIWLSLLNLA